MKGSCKHRRDAFISAVRAGPYYHDDFIELTARYPNLRYVPALSGPPPMIESCIRTLM